MAVPRSKTFTGCWTCRSRRIKCDLSRPGCEKCRKAHLKCEGYSIKLYWNTGESEVDSMNRRRTLDFVRYPDEMMYEYYDDIDKILTKLHSPQFLDRETIKCGPFGVFQCGTDLFDKNDMPVEKAHDRLLIPTIYTSAFIRMQDNCVEGFTGPENYWLTKNAGFLLNYYIDNIVDNMSVSCSDKNPWRTIYLRGALRAVSDVAVTGKTSNARRALLHALLAVSAFHFSQKQPAESTTKHIFYKLGSAYKSEAYRCLNTSIINNDESDKYKDLLCVVLSMVTMDFVVRSAVDSKGHLIACAAMVTERQIKRPRLSRKAQSLHRIAGFLKILQDSTNMDFSDLDSLENKDTTSWIDFSFEEYAAQNNHMNLTTDFNEITSFPDYWNKRSNVVGCDALPKEFYTKELTSTFEIYGIPDSLIVLFAQVTSIGRHVLMYRSSGQPIPESLAQSCSELEVMLIAWQNRYNPSQSNIPFGGDQKEIMIAHMQAFHRALVIYYVRIGRNVDTKAVHNEVEEILNHLEHMQHINAKHEKPLAIPLIFSAFMGACEIDFDNLDGEGLRARYEAWFDQMAVEGLGTYSAVREIIEEVWEWRSTRNQSCDWWDLLRQGNINLILC